jgi:hypothetical protein
MVVKRTRVVRGKVVELEKKPGPGKSFTYVPKRKKK